MSDKEATARIKINKLLEQSGWRFFAEGSSPANIRLELTVTIKSSDLDALGVNFEKTGKGFIDFLLLDAKGFPLIVLEAKSEDKNPLVGKEQARRYAKSQNCRFVILSNGNLHYFWDLERGNPYLITSFPTPESVVGYKKVTPNLQRLLEEQVGDDYIVLTQRPNYLSEAAWRDQAERPGYIQVNNLRFLRPYQLKAIHALQRAMKDRKDRFLFEMATGTGKTLLAAAIIKLFLRTGNGEPSFISGGSARTRGSGRQEGFLASAIAVRRLQDSLVYKETRDDWRRAEIVVTTVQSLLFNNKYQKLFSPTDFDLVISDEAHRSIGGNARAVFDYFIGYKLGLTATPRDYLRRFDHSNPTTRDPREAERRLLLETYRTFGCCFKNGLNFNKASSGHTVKIIGVSDFQTYLFAPLADLDEVHLDAPLTDEYLVRGGDILFVRSNGNPDLVGRSVIVPPPSEPTTFSGFTIRGRIEDDRALPLFYAHSSSLETSQR